MALFATAAIVNTAHEAESGRLSTTKEFAMGQLSDLSGFIASEVRGDATGGAAAVARPPNAPASTLPKLVEVVDAASKVLKHAVALESIAKNSDLLSSAENCVEQALSAIFDYAPQSHAELIQKIDFMRSYVSNFSDSEDELDRCFGAIIRDVTVFTEESKP